MSGLATTLTRETSPSGASSFRADFVWTLLGSAVYSGSQWGILILLAKLGTPEMVGQYALGIAVATPMLMFANLQLRGLMTTDAAGATSPGIYIGLRVLSTLAACIALVPVCALMGTDRHSSGVVLVVGFSQAIEAISDIYYARMQLNDNMRRVSWSMIVRGALSLFALVLGLRLTGTIVGAISAVCLVRLLVLVTFDMWDEQPGRGSGLVLPRWDFRMHRELLKAALPMGIVALLVSLNTNIPRYFIQWSAGERQLGIFAAAGFLLSAGNLVAGSLGQAAITRLSRAFAAARVAQFLGLLRRLCLIGMGMGLAGVVIAILFGGELLARLYRPEYAEARHILVWLMITAGVGYVAQFTGVAMTAARVLRPQLPLFGVVTAAIAAASAWLIPTIGVLGSVLAMLIGTSIQLAGSVLVLKIAIQRLQAEGLS